MATKPTNHSKSNAARLFGAVPTQEIGVPVSGLMLLDPNRIETAPQPRTQFDDAGLSELAESIRERREKQEGVEGTGILQPLLVSSPEIGTYRLIAGERRLRAARKLDLPFVPAVIVPDNPRERLISQLVENLQRANLNPLEEARALDAWMKENKFSVRDAAATIGKDKNYISNRIRLIKMREDVQQMVGTRADALVHAQIIEAVQEPELRQQLIKNVIEAGISVAELKRLIHPPEEETEDDQVSLHRDNKKPKDNDAEEIENEEKEVSLRRDTLAPMSFLSRVKGLKATGVLLTNFGDLKELSPDDKTLLKRKLASLARKIRKLEQALDK